MPEQQSSNRQSQKLRPPQQSLRANSRRSTSRGSRVSKREKEFVIEEFDAELMKQFLMEPTLTFPKAAPSEIMNYLADSKNRGTGTRGVVRCLETRVIFKQGSQKPRLIDASYGEVEQFYLEKVHPNVLIVGLSNDETRRSKTFELLRFKDSATAHKCADHLEECVKEYRKRPLQSRYSEDVDRRSKTPNTREERQHRDSYPRADEVAMRELSTTPQRLSNRPLPSVSRQSMDDARPLLVDECKFVRYNSDHLTNFPDRMPDELRTVIKEDDYDHSGIAYCYDDCLEVKSEGRGDLIWRADYDKVQTVYKVKSRPHNTVWAMMKDGEPSHYGVLKFKSEHKRKEMTDFLQRTGMRVEQADHMPADDRGGRRTRTLYPNENANEVLIVEEKVGSVQAAGRRNLQAPHYRDHSKNGFFTVSKTKVSKMRPAFQDHEKLKEELNKAPGEGWRSDLTFLDEDQNGTTLVDEGPVYIYVARKTAPHTRTY